MYDWFESQHADNIGSCQFHTERRQTCDNWSRLWIHSSKCGARARETAIQWLRAVNSWHWSLRTDQLAPAAAAAGRGGGKVHDTPAYNHHFAYIIATVDLLSELCLPLAICAPKTITTTGNNTLLPGLSAPSSVISRPTCFSSSLRCCWQVGSAPFLRRRCDCLASSAPFTNIQTYLLTYAPQQDNTLVSRYRSGWGYR